MRSTRDVAFAGGTTFDVREETVSDADPQAFLALSGTDPTGICPVGVRQRDIGVLETSGLDTPPDGARNSTPVGTR